MPKTPLSFYLHIIAIAVIVFAAGHFLLSSRAERSGVEGSATKQETAYERVMRTKILRCGYFIEPPFTMVDGSGTKSGIAADLITQIAAEIGLRIEWTQEINLATMTEDLEYKRYDAVCGGLFILTRSGRIDYTAPFAKTALHGYVRADDVRFDRLISDVDWPSIKISGMDGEGATAAARKILPQAQLEILPQNAQIAEMLLSVSSGKTDIAFVIPGVFKNFDMNNPGLLKQAGLDRPLYVYNFAFGLPVEEPGLKRLLDIAIAQRQVSGELEQLIRKYDAVQPYAINQP
jgi:ABC-type amino acid transport substrate-binding protein